MSLRALKTFQEMAIGANGTLTLSAPRASGAGPVCAWGRLPKEESAWPTLSRASRPARWTSSAVQMIPWSGRAKSIAGRVNQL